MQSSRTNPQMTPSTTNRQTGRTNRPTQPSAGQGSRKRIFFLCIWIASLILFVVCAYASHTLFRRFFHAQPEVYRTRCAEMLKAGNYEGVEREARKAIGANICDFDAHLLLAESLSRRGNSEAAYHELGSLEEIADRAGNRTGPTHGQYRLFNPVTGYDVGKIFYLMGTMDFQAGRFDQGVSNLLRVIDEAHDYVVDAPDGLMSIRSFLQDRFPKAKSAEELLALCRLLGAIGEVEPAREILNKVATDTPAAACAARLLAAEMDMYAWWSTNSPAGLATKVSSVKAQLDGVLKSNPDFLCRLWATLLLGNDGKPTAALSPEALLEAVAGKPVKVLLPKDFHVVSPSPPTWGVVVDNTYAYNLGLSACDFTLDKPARQLVLLARGTSALRSWPYVVVRLDGREVGRVYLRLFAYRPYVIPMDVPAGKHRLDFEFLNYEGEKNLGLETHAYFRAALLMP